MPRSRLSGTAVTRTGPTQRQRERLRPSLSPRQTRSPEKLPHSGRGQKDSERFGCANPHGPTYAGMEMPVWSHDLQSCRLVPRHSRAAPGGKENHTAPH